MPTRNRASARPSRRSLPSSRSTLLTPRSEDPFFRMIKDMTVDGYYTSKAGLTAGTRLARQHLPHRIQGLHPSGAPDANADPQESGSSRRRHHRQRRGRRHGRVESDAPGHERSDARRRHEVSALAVLDPREAVGGAAAARRRASSRRSSIVDPKTAAVPDAARTALRPRCACGGAAARPTSGAASSLRYSDLDFAGAERDGWEIPWPIRYKDIAPYYDQVDQLIGVCGGDDDQDSLPGSKYHLPPPAPRCGERLLQKAAQQHRRQHRGGTARRAHAAAQRPRRLPLLRRLRHGLRRRRILQFVRLSDRAGAQHRRLQVIDNAVVARILVGRRRPRQRRPIFRPLHERGAPCARARGRGGGLLHRFHAHSAELEIARGIRTASATRPTSSAAILASRSVFTCSASCRN